MTHDPTTPPWKQTHHRQTDRGQGEELASQFSPLCHLKRNSNRLHSTQPPHPTHSSVCGTTLLRKVSPRQLPITLPSLWFAPGNSVPSSFLQPPASSSVTPTPCHLLRPSLLSGPPRPRASGRAASPASSFLPARASPGPLHRMWDSHCCPTLLEVRG